MTLVFEEMDGNLMRFLFCEMKSCKILPLEVATNATKHDLKMKFPLLTFESKHAYLIFFIKIILNSVPKRKI